MALVFEKLYWEKKRLVFTWHFMKELETLKNDVFLAQEILENGHHLLISKNQKKFNVFKSYNKIFICLSYIEEDSRIILVHIKPVRRKKWKDLLTNATNVK